MVPAVMVAEAYIYALQVNVRKRKHVVLANERADLRV